MAVSQEKIKERLRALFPKANLSKQRLDAIAAKLASKPEDDATDEQVDEVINDYNDVIDFEQIARDDDRIRTLESARRQKPETQENKQDVVDAADDDTPKWAKTLLAKVEKLESDKIQETVSQKFTKQAKSKGIPDAWIKRSIPSSEDDIEDVLSELEADWKDFADKNKLQNYGLDQPPAGEGNRNPGKIKPKSVDDVKDLAQTI